MRGGKTRRRKTARKKKGWKKKFKGKKSRVHVYLVYYYNDSKKNISALAAIFRVIFVTSTGAGKS